MVVCGRSHNAKTCYIYFNRDWVQTHWLAARRRCQSLIDEDMSYDLVKIDDKLKNKIVRSLIQTDGDQPWIGLERNGSDLENTFQWTDGTFLKRAEKGSSWIGYENWKSGEPNNDVR